MFLMTIGGIMQVFDGFIAAIASELKIPFHKTGEGQYTANIEFSNNRHQEVLITLDKDESGDRTIHYYSVIGKIDKETCGVNKFALKKNARLDYGAIALIDGTLVLNSSMLLKNCEPERFIKSLIYIAAKADELEDELTGHDWN